MHKNNKVNRQVLRTRGWVFNALLILLETMPYEEVKISNITDKAGVARQTFYRNYKSKDDIIIKYLDDLFTEYRIRIKGLQDKDREEQYALPFKILMEHKDELIRIKNAKLEYLLFEQFWNYNKLFYNYMLKKGTKTNNKQYLEYSIKYQMGGITAIMVEWIKLDMPVPPEKIGGIISEIAKNFSDQEVYIPISHVRRDKDVGFQD